MNEKNPKTIDNRGNFGKDNLRTFIRNYLRYNNSMQFFKKAKKKRTCIDQQISQSQSYNKPTLGFHYFERQCFQEINQIMKIFEKNDTSSVKKFTRVIYI